MNNTVKRTISGIAFIAIMLCGLLIDKLLFAALFVLIMAGMMTEFYHMTFDGKFRYSRAVATLSGVSLFILLFLACCEVLPYQYVGFSMLGVIVLMILSLYSKDRDEFGMFSHIYTGILYIAVPLSLANLVAFSHGEFSGRLLLSFFIIIWASDVGAYVFGTTLGKKWDAKLFPEISPKKSWAGFWGGMLCSVLAGMVLKACGMFAFPMMHAAVLAALMHVAGVYGDLFESQWKRSYGLKDSGNIIPGHGGLLDRFDSTLMAFPSGVLYLLLFGLI